VTGDIPEPTISVSPSPAVDPGGEPNTIYLGYGAQSVTLTATGGVSYSWSPATYLSCTDCAAPTFAPDAAGEYTFTVTTANSYGCSATASVTISVIDVFSGTNKVTVCLNGNTLQVNYHALAALIEHAGATLGPCVAKSTSGVSVATQYSLSQNYPNPFNPVTQIEYGIPETGNVRLAVFDLFGREVERLVNEPREAGTYQVHFDGAHHPSGVYVYRLEWNGQVITRRMTLLK
jgi:hypothetical protein